MDKTAYILNVLRGDKKACECEHSKCHSENNCNKTAILIVKVFGFKTPVCMECFSNTFRVEAK